MPSPYDSIFGEDAQPQSKPERTEEELSVFSNLPPLKEGDTVPALDELVAHCAAFGERARGFGQLLTQLRVVDHEVPPFVKQRWLQYLIKVDDPHAKASLAAERKYYQLLEDKFRAVIEPMKVLAEQHLTCLKQFVTEIDEHYFDPKRTDIEVKQVSKQVKDDILLQRQILHEARQTLIILTEAMVATELRLRQYVNAGGVNNLASAELALLQKERRELTAGQEHVFDYTFFELNALDQVALKLGYLSRQTSAQYLDNLSLALTSKS